MWPGGYVAAMLGALWVAHAASEWGGELGQTTVETDQGQAPEAAECEELLLSSSWQLEKSGFLVRKPLSSLLHSERGGKTVRDLLFVCWFW